MSTHQNSPPKTFTFLHIPELAKLDSIQADIQELKQRYADPLEEYISKEEFLEKFNIKMGLYYKLLKSGSLKVYHLKSKCYLRRSEIDEAIKKGLLK